MTQKTSIKAMKKVHHQKTVDRLQVRRGGDQLAKRTIQSITRL